MKDKYTAIANTNENGLTQGKKYILESDHTGIVDIYDIDGNYLMSHRTDSFDNYIRI